MRSGSDVRRVRAWVLAGTCAIAGCGFTAPQTVGDGGTGDGPRPDAADGSLCFGEIERICLDALPSGPFMVGGGLTAPINTDTSTFCKAPAVGSSVSAACVIAGTSVLIDGTLRATGSRPLVIVSTSSLTINGTGLVDVSSRGWIERGAGVRLTCAVGTPPLPTGGGAGGSFGALGGPGGAGSLGVGGTATPATGLVGLAGGCPGTDGGATTPGDAGAGGFGGGTVDLIAVIGVTINGRVNASGGGGNGGQDSAGGGGGGGAGGAIVLDAPAVTLNGSGAMFAQGGGGGEGAGDAGAGQRGQDPSTPGTAATGGNGLEPGGGDGGAGGVTAAGDAGLEDNDSGGGGGGGAGHIRCTDASPTTGGDAFPAMQCP